MVNIIETNNIHRTYGKGPLAYHVLKGISMNVPTGEFLAIMGKSGAGKSTLLYQLSGLDHPSEGQIRISNTEIAALTEEELVSFRLNTLGYVFQDYALIPDLSALENVALPIMMKGIAFSEAKEIATSALNTVDLKDKYKNLPFELSGGEQQRVAIARAIAGKPKILFADEPTANLDSASGKAVIKLLAAIHDSGQTIVMVTHEQEYANFADRIIYLEDGIITSETHNSVQ